MPVVRKLTLNKLQHFYEQISFHLVNWIIFFFLYSLIGWSHCLASEKPLVVIIPSYNNALWFELNLNSILIQDYHNYRMIYIDDGSTDETGIAVENFFRQKQLDYCQLLFDDTAETISEATENFIKLINQNKHPIILVRNLRRCGALTNLYRAIHSCQDQEIIVTVDGDDCLYHTQVFKKLNEIYSSDIWLTHGRLIEYPTGNASWCEPIPVEIIEQNTFRTFKCPSHLRTFYAWLFKKIQLQDLLFQGEFFPMAWDMAMMFPMAEMAGPRQAFINEINYVYNMANQINDNKVNPQLQRDLDKYIRCQPPYKKLEKAP